MKLNKFLAVAVLAAVTLVGCDTNPGGGPEIKKTTPDVEATEGAVTVVWNIANYDDMCDVGYVFAGNYNGWNTEPSEMAHFEAIEDYEGWYKVVIALPEDVDHLEGKPCALALDGTFPSGWDYQWIGTEDYPVELLRGSAEFEIEYDVESKLVCATEADVVFVKSYAFKSSPCVESVFDNVTFNLTVTTPVTDGGIVYIVGDAFEESWNVEAYPMQGSGSNWTITLPAIVGKQYKFAVNGNWDNDQVAAPAAEGDCLNGASNMTVDFTTMNDVVYGFFNYGIDAELKCQPEE